MSVIGAHAHELLALLTVVLAAGTAATLGWGPQIRVTARPATIPVDPPR